MKKFPVIQKVQLNICGICEAELFYGGGEFKTLEAEENFYDFLYPAWLMPLRFIQRAHLH